MSEPVARLGDECSGHGAFPPRANTGASSDVFIEGKGVHRQGDSWASHCDPDTCHVGTTSGGSSTVFVNGEPIARIGDSVSCGSTIAEGSSSVNSG